MSSSPDIVSESSKPDFPPGLAPKMLGMLNGINALRSQMAQLIKYPHHEALAKLDNLERAKVNILQANIVNYLYWVSLKMSGDNDISNLESDMKLEMKRVKEAQSKVSEIEARATMQRIDRQAAGRFIMNGLGKSTKRKSSKTEDREEVSSNDSSSKGPRKKTKLEQEIDNAWC